MTINVDASLNGASANPIQNKVVKEAFDHINNLIGTKADINSLNTLNGVVNTKADKAALGTQVSYSLSGTTLTITTK